MTNDDVRWFRYLKAHRNTIVEWVDNWVPGTLSTHLNNMILDPNIGRHVLEPLIHEAWNQVPDTEGMRTDGFFRVCDLLDGGYDDSAS